MSKRILFLTNQLPYPPVSGGTIKSWKLIEFLSAQYDVFAAYFLKGDDSLHQADFLERVELEGYSSVSLEIGRNAGSFLMSNLLGIPLNLYRNRSGVFRRKIRRIAGDYPVLFVDHYEMYQYVPKDYRGKVILHQHNAEYLIWERFAEVEPSFLRRKALRNQAWRIRNYERRICNRSDVVLAAPNDIEELKQIGATETTYMETYHLGDAELLDLADLQFGETEEALMFVGTLTWEANIDGLLWFLQAVWPDLKARFPALKFYIIGKHPDPRIVRLVEAAGEDVVLTGFVKDLEDYFSKCRVFVSPLRFGSGIKVKVMNAMYRGIPTSTTPVGAEGLDVAHGTHLMIDRDVPAMVDSISRLLTDKALWETLRDRSRELAREKYTWEAVLEIVREAVEGE